MGYIEQEAEGPRLTAELERFKKALKEIVDYLDSDNYPEDLDLPYILKIAREALGEE